jgi:hypothetical protein
VWYFFRVHCVVKLQLCRLELIDFGLVVALERIIPAAFLVAKVGEFGDLLALNLDHPPQLVNIDL